MQRMTWARLIAFTATTGGICAGLVALALAGTAVGTDLNPQPLAAEMVAAASTAAATNSGAWGVVDLSGRQLPSTGVAPAAKAPVVPAAAVAAPRPVAPAPAPAV